MKGRCLPWIVLSIVLFACVTVNEANSHKLVKRQFPSRGGLPLSRSRQFPPPEELEEVEYSSEDEEAPPPPRGRQVPPSSSEEEDEEYAFTEAPKLTSPATTAKPRLSVFNTRVNARPRFGSASSSTQRSTHATTPRPPSRFGATPAQSQRLDVVANVLNKPPPPRSRAIATSRTGNENNKPEADIRRSSNSTRARPRGRIRTRSTTTTTTTTTPPPPSEEYYYYYEDDDSSAKSPSPIATTTSTTTPRPRISSFNRPRPVSIASSSPKVTKAPAKAVKFDIESQFAPPPEDVVEVAQPSSSTKRFTTSSTMSPEESGGIPPHLRNRYRPRKDGRFIDFLRDPNRPRELKGFDLTDYPFYIVVPDDIDFDCDDKKDGYYASIPHKCQLFHYCFAGHRYDFLCANYTLYDQTTFTCRFAINVDCEASAKHYYRNDELWKETTTTTTTTTTRPPRRRRPQKDEDYEDEDYEDEDYEEERRRERRRKNRRRNNRRRQKEKEEAEEDEKEEKKK